MSKQRSKEPVSGTVHQNGGFGSSFGFVLACVGSAVGMGNIWMFPYRVGQYGGCLLYTSQKTCLSSGYFICCGQSRCLLFSSIYWTV